MIEISAAIQNAEISLNLMQLAFDTSMIATFGSQPESAPLKRLASLIADASNRGVSVRILLNVNLVVNTYDDVKEYFGRQAPGVEVRRFPLGIEVMHAKALIVDGASAFVIGSPFDQGYWDTTEHLLGDVRRGKGASGIGKRPIHEVSVLLRGGAVRAVDELFAELWNDRSDKEFGGAGKVTPAPNPPAGGDQVVRVARTLPERLLTGYRRGEREILKEYVDAIRSAQTLIYIENQYLTSREIVHALRERLRRDDGVDVILLLNEEPDIPTYRALQNDRLEQLGRHPGLGVFALWRALRDFEGELRIQSAYVHSKFAAVDDRWATVGTANLDGMSLSSGEDFGKSVQNIGGAAAVLWRSFPTLVASAVIAENLQRLRSVELNASVLDETVDGERNPVTRMRRVLWAEHLGIDFRNDGIPAADEGLEAWRRIARANVQALGRGTAMQGRILEYQANGNPRQRLSRLGVDVRRIRVLDNAGRVM